PRDGDMPTPPTANPPSPRRSPLPFAPGSLATLLYLSSETPHPDAVACDPTWWQVSWLAVLAVGHVSQDLMPGCAMAVTSAAYRCGGSRGFARHSGAPTAFPFDPTSGTTVRHGRIHTIARSRKIRRSF